MAFLPAKLISLCSSRERSSLSLRKFHHVTQHVRIALEVCAAVEIEDFAGQP
jgi:hypothetical protein